jgi:hypothetical protein
VFVVPARESGEEDEAEKGEDDGDDAVLSLVLRVYWKWNRESTYSKYGKTTASLNVLAIQIRFSGS